MNATTYSAIPRKHFVCRIPADAARYTDEIEMRTTAFDEFDMRHVLRCAFGKWASEEATVEEVCP